MGCISDDERKKGTEKSWSENSREKRRKTNLEKYGTEWPTQNAEVLSKRNDSFFKNGSTKTSKPQIDLYNILKKKYENCELNYPCSNFLLDCKIEINNVKINSVLDLRLEIYKYSSGDILNIKLIRDGKEMEIRYNLQEKM